MCFLSRQKIPLGSLLANSCIRQRFRWLDLRRLYRTVVTAHVGRGLVLLSSGITSFAFMFSHCIQPTAVDANGVLRKVGMTSVVRVALDDIFAGRPISFTVYMARWRLLLTNALVLFSMRSSVLCVSGMPSTYDFVPVNGQRRIRQPDPFRLCGRWQKITG